MSFCLRVVPRFGGNVNINKPLAACNGTSTQYMLFSAINGRVLVLIYYPRRARSALGVDIVLTLDVCMFVCLYVSALERKRLIGMT